MANDKRNIWKGLAAGAAAGIAATFVMTQYQGLAQNLTKDKEGGLSGEKEEPATVKAANMISENLLDHKLDKSEKKLAGQTMHYLMGGVSGAVYGATAEYLSLAKVGGGFPFGTAVWAIADDVVVPALGLSKSPLKYPLSTHAYALSSHWIYGTVSEFVRKRIRAAL